MMFRLRPLVRPLSAAAFAVSAMGGTAACLRIEEDVKLDCALRAVNTPCRVFGLNLLAAHSVCAIVHRQRCPPTTQTQHAEISIRGGSDADIQIPPFET